MNLIGQQIFTMQSIKKAYSILKKMQIYIISL